MGPNRRSSNQLLFFKQHKPYPAPDPQKTPPVNMGVHNELSWLIAIGRPQ